MNLPDLETAPCSATLQPQVVLLGKVRKSLSFPGRAIELPLLEASAHGFPRMATFGASSKPAAASLVPVMMQGCDGR
jgi:hypothetical protein